MTVFFTRLNQLRKRDTHHVVRRATRLNHPGVLRVRLLGIVQFLEKKRPRLKAFDLITDFLVSFD